MEMTRINNIVVDGLIGFCIGDAMGVPVEFYKREQLEDNPVINMRAFGTHKQPKGTWSDDSSLTFCLAESLINGIDYEDMGKKFCEWAEEGYWTPYGKAFGIGRTTLQSLGRIKKGVKSIEAGGKLQKDNGNGSLMRILPVAFYLEKYECDNRFEIIKNISSITHSHPKSYISCIIYIEFAINLIRGNSKEKAYSLVKNEWNKILDDNLNNEELLCFKRIMKKNIAVYDVSEIKSSGYVVDTLEASLWSFLKSNSYKDAILKAVNLGGDTDTIAAITGGLAGIYYGMKDMPKNWIDDIVRKEDIIDLGNRLYNSF